MLFQNFCDTAGRLRIIPVTDPTVTPPGAVFMRGLAWHPSLNAVYCNILGLSSDPSEFDEPFDYAIGSLEVVSDGAWQKIREQVSPGYLRVDPSGILHSGAGGQNVAYSHVSAGEFAGRAQYAEITIQTLGDNFAVMVNATGNGSTLSGYRVYTSVVGWPPGIGYMKNGALVNLQGMATPNLAIGERLGVFYDPATPQVIEVYRDGVLKQTYDFSATSGAGLDQGGVPAITAFSDAVPEPSITRYRHATAVISTQATGPAPFVQPDDVWIAGLRVSKAGVIYAQVNGVGTQTAPGAILCTADGVFVGANEVFNVVLAGVGMLDDGTITGYDATGSPLNPFSSGFSNGFGL
jgi:hypothetical protein